MKQQTLAMAADQGEGFKALRQFLSEFGYLPE